MCTALVSPSINITLPVIMRLCVFCRQIYLCRILYLLGILDLRHSNIVNRLMRHAMKAGLKHAAFHFKINLMQS